MEAPTRAPFVGRARELTDLERVLAAAGEGRGTTLLVAGDAGIGKTRLAAEFAARADAAGFDVLLGRSIDFVGTELPYQPFVDALGPLGERDAHAPTQLSVFEQVLAMIVERAPVVVVLEDVHWADTSTLDLVVFLAHNLAEERIVLLATCRAGELVSAARMRRLADGVRRSGSAFVVELGPLSPDELTALITAQSGTPPPRAHADQILARSEGNPFFAEELLAAGEADHGLPQVLQDLLLQQVGQLDAPTQSLLRVAAAAGRDVSYALLRGLAGRPEGEVRDALRAAVEHRVLVADQASGSFRFRHSLLAEAIYATILPGEREELHARLAEELSRSGEATAAELAPHWAAAGRGAEALVASVEAARRAEEVFGLAEAHAHLERALALWEAVPDAVELVRIDHADAYARAARLASQVGASARAVELSRRAIEIVGVDEPRRATILHVDLAEYLYQTGSVDNAFAELEQAAQIASTTPPSRERAYALGSLAGGLMMAQRDRESLAAADEALALARTVGAGEAEVRALTVRGVELARSGRADEGVAELRRALKRAEEIGDHWGLERVYVNFTDTLTMLGRSRESARIGQTGLAAMRRYGIHSAVLLGNVIEAQLAIGDWDEAERLSADSLRGVTSSYAHWLLAVRALVETERGQFDAARAHFEAADAGSREDRGNGLHDAWRARLALWEHRWADADAAVETGLAHARQPEAVLIRVQLCAAGLRAQAELALLARARRDDRALRDRLGRAQALVRDARRAEVEAPSVTRNVRGWVALAEAEYHRVLGEARPDAWSDAAAGWDELEHVPLAAYCRLRQADALVATGASRTVAAVPLREAHVVAARLGAKPLQREIELLAERARLDLAAPAEAADDFKHRLESEYGLTPREVEVLMLVARGYTNREIAAALVISEKTASAHLSHILRKLNAPTRLHAAAVAHGLTPPRLQNER